MRRPISSQVKVPSEPPHDDLSVVLGQVLEGIFDGSNCRPRARLLGEGV